MSMLGLGGIPDRRVDQRNLATSRAGVGPAPQTGTFVGRLVIIFGSGQNTGLFVYSPSPGTGNLIASIAAAPGTDPYGNAYKAGVTSYLPGSVLSQLVTGAVILSSNAAATRITQGGHLLLTDAAADNATPEMEVKAPTTTVGTAGSVQLLGGSKDGSKLAQVLIGPATLNPKTTADVELQGAISGVTAAGLAGSVPLTQTDATAFTITAATSTQASKAWPIPANDANAGTRYRLTVEGFGTEGSTAQNLSVTFALNGAALRTVVSPALTASGGFRFKVVLELQVKTTGAGGTAQVSVIGAWSTSATPAVSNPFVTGSPAAGGEAFNTTVGNTMQLNLGWASVTGAPTITTFGSLFERLGP